MRKRTNHNSNSRRFTGRRARGVVLALCMIGVVATCLGIAGYREMLHAQEDQEMTRGVINSLGQIPLTKKNLYDGKAPRNYELGSKENPFFILEVVPYEEFAHFGYMISGCEPVDVEHNQGHSQCMTVMDDNDLKTAISVKQSQAYFFKDEPESEASMYDSGVAPEETTKYGAAFKGYYEMVEDGKGSFRQNPDGSIVKENGGNLIWHTICESEMENEYKDQEFSKADASSEILSKVGDRIYTERISSEEDPVLMTHGYYYYKNHDNFLRKSLNVKEENLDSYSVIIKTITPKELNENPKWTEYADLYVVSRQEYLNAATESWKKYNRLGHKSNETSYTLSFVNTQNNSNRDLSWEVVEKMYFRIRAQKNYAAIIMGSSLLTLNDSALSGSMKTGIDLKLYDWNLKDTGKRFTHPGAQSNNNVFKLAVMLTSMNPNLFDQLYWDEENPYIKDGKDLLQDGDEQTYWSMYTFLLVEPDNEEALSNPDGYWKSEGMWEKYGISGEHSNGRSWINDRLFTFNDDTSLAAGYMDYKKSDDKFTDYQDFLDKIYQEPGHEGTAADSVRYILDREKDGDDPFSGKLNILDIEPSYDVENGYTLQKSYVYMMLPNFKGEINITHMTTAEFIGNETDLGNTYQMIYLGMDAGAYNWADQWLGYARKQGEYTYWNDVKSNSYMPGKIYFHTGDVLQASEQSQAVDFLWSAKGGKKVAGQTLRFAGNDITNKKIKDLERFVDAGNPVVATPYLYQTDAIRVDQNSNICKFIKKQKKQADTTLYVATDPISIMKNVNSAKPKVSFDQTPKQYPEYVSRNSKGQAVLNFKFSVTDKQSRAFAYKLYLDWNQDGSFDEEEVEKADDASYEQSVTCTIPKTYIGVIEWKLVVYCKDNEAICFTKSGFSEAENINGRQTINVLQIVPKEGSYQGALDLSSDNLFTKYYDDIKDYEIDVTTMTAAEYQELFNADHPFEYNYAQLDEDGAAVFPSEYSDEQMELYQNYHLIVLGFGEDYAGVNFNNGFGAVDFLRFFIAEGKSVIFTHDQTSANNTSSTGAGYTMNTLMRDLMGMNRYQAVNNKLSTGERNAQMDYQGRHIYDTVTSVNDGSDLEEKHGFTYYAMKKLGYPSTTKNEDNSDQRMPYKALGGFNNEEDLTTEATRVNQGLITEYPFAIEDSIPVAKTHAQTYQLNMEDPNMRVWYCLADDKKSSTEGTALTYGVSPNDTANNYYVYSMGNVFYSGIGHSEVTGEMEAKLFINTLVAAYRASYKAPIVEVLNPEAELLDRAKMEYRLTFAQEYMDDGHGGGYTDHSGDAMFDSREGVSGSIKVQFSPEDFNQQGANLNCSLYYEANGTKHYIETIYYMESENASPVQLDAQKNAEGIPVFKNVKNRGNYYFLYPKKYLYEWSNEQGTQDPRRDVQFCIKNDKTRLPGYTNLDLFVKSLFILD